MLYPLHYLLHFFVSISHLAQLFFFSCYADHRDLHSFPTRRSSDLSSACARRGCDRHVPSDGFPSRLLGRRRRRARRHRWSYDRSEEHTSELQSQFHLVCRLLLEKKKKSRRS